MAPTVQHVINNWAAATELRLPSMHTAHPHWEDLPLKAAFQMFSDLLDKLFDAQERLRLTHRAAQENGKGSEWLFLILVRRNSGLRPLRCVVSTGQTWRQLSHQDQIFVLLLVLVHCTLYMYCCTLILFLFIVKTELRLNWRLNFAVPLSQHSTNCWPAPISKSFQEFAFSLLARKGFWRLFFSSQGRILEICWEQKNLQLFAAEQVSDHVEGGLSLCNHLH